MIKPDKIEEVIKEITDSIKSQTDIATLGMSGGADSTLVAILCTLALGRRNVYGYGMPFNELDKNTFNSTSKDIAKSLNINYEEISINAPAGMTKLLLEKHHPELSPLNLGNLRSRMRMVFLYTLNTDLGEVHKKRARVIGTSNKSESFIGYDTKYGDSGVDMFPIDNLFKSEVYQLLDYFVEKGVITEDMVDRDPSAGLWDGQTDEEELGYSYDEMEYPIKFCLLNYDQMDTILENDVSEVVRFVWERHKANKHKQEPVFTTQINTDMLCNYKLRSHNDSVVYPDNSFLKNNKEESFRIVGKVDTIKHEKVSSVYLIEFCDKYKYRMCAHSDALLKGAVKNPYTPSLYGVGFMGNGPFKSVCISGKHSKEYRLFKNMMDRSYGEDYHERNPTYKDCSVAERWHNFQNFCEDIQYLEGYNSWVLDRSTYELDKDIKVKGNKVYSKDTCMFVTRGKNNKSGNKSHPKPLTGLTYIATRLEDEYTEEFTNQADFADKYNLQRSKVNCCIKGNRKTHKGWRFQIK